MYAAQLATIVFQFVYAAITSRAINPAGFGSYAIALAVSGLVTLVAVGGLAQAVARMDALTLGRLRSLVTYATLLGAVAGAFMWCTADAWAYLWGDQGATAIVRWLAIGASVAPMAALSGSLLRRQGRFKAIAILSLATNLIGMVLGVTAVMVLRTPEALVVSPVVAQIALLVASLVLSGRALRGFARIRKGSIEVAFSAQLVPAKLADYVIGNATKFSTSRWVGVDAFGFWNRADVVTSLPIQQIQTAIVQAISPEFRHDIHDSSRANRVWTDMLILISWVALPLAGLAAVVVPFLVPVMFGRGWDTTAALVPWLAIAAGFQMLATILASAIEVLGRMKWIWSTAIALLVVQAAGAIALFLFRDLIVAMICLVSTQILRHAINIWQCGRLGYLDVPKLMRGYLTALSATACLAFFAWLVCVLTSGALSTGASAGAIVSGAIVVVVCAVLVLAKSKLPPVKIAIAYGILRIRPAK
jgi:O-antigen/teichoic acid export membrane protein